jgi:transposase InsO family protein
VRSKVGALRRLSHAVKVTACSTIHAILDRHGLVTRAKRSRTRIAGTPLSSGLTPKALWCIDYKSEFQLGNKRYCYPLTVTDHASRYLLLCEAMESNQEQFARAAFERSSQNGVYRKRSARTAAYSLLHPWSLQSLELSVWWLLLGISIERIRPGHPQQNGRHERMHLTLKKGSHPAASRQPPATAAKFDPFLEEFNNERPHEALDMKCPVEVYTASTRPYRGLGEPHYPFHDKTVVVTNCGRLCLYRKKINLSTSLAGQAVGIKEVDDGIWLVSFMDYDLGYVDLEEKTLQPLNNPFGPKVLPMSPVWTHESVGCGGLF